MSVMPDIEWVTWCNNERIGGCWALATVAGNDRGLIGLLFNPGGKPDLDGIGLVEGQLLTIKANRARSPEIDTWVYEVSESPLVVVSLVKDPLPAGRGNGLLDFIR